MRQKKHSRSLIHAFTPIRWYLQSIGQLPFKIIDKVIEFSGFHYVNINGESRRHLVKDDGTHAFHFKLLSCETLSFIIVTLLYSIIYILITIGGIMTLFKVRPSTSSGGISYIKIPDPFGGKENVPWDEVMMTNNIVVIVIYWTWLTMTFVGSMYILTHGNKYVHYFNYWNRVVQIIDMDLTEGIKRFVTWQTALTLALTVIFVFIFWFVASCRAASGVVACCLFKFFISDLPDRKWFVVAEVFGFMIVIYGFIGIKAVVIQFIFFTRLLSNGAACWNSRLLNTLHRRTGDGDETDGQDFRRTSYNLLLKDHFIIVQLFKLTESVFALVLQFYYLTRVLCLIVEILFLYYLLGPEYIEIIRFQKTSFTNATNSSTTTESPVTDSDYFAQQQKIVSTMLAFLLLAETVGSCYTTNEHASVAHVEAMKGFQIVRKHGFISCGGSAEKNFIHTLVVSFARNNPIVISAGGYFVVNKALVVGIVGTICAYFIILIQFPREYYTIDESAFHR